MTAGPVTKPRTLDLPQFSPAPRGTQGSTAAAPAPKLPPEPPRPLQLPLEKSPSPPQHPPAPRRSSLNYHRNAANATTAVEILAQVSEAIALWHGELRQVIEQMQQVYRGGPLVDGWLEAMTTRRGGAHIPQEQRAFWRHSDPAQLNQYLETCWGQLAPRASTPPSVSQPVSQPMAPHQEPSPTAYRLCHLDGEGQVQCQVCPPEQLGAISQGIARYQQLRQLEQRKQWLEEKLRQAAIALGNTRDRLGLPTPPTT